MTTVKQPAKLFTCSVRSQYFVPGRFFIHFSVGFIENYRQESTSLKHFSFYFIVVLKKPQKIAVKMGKFYIDYSYRSNESDRLSVGVTF